MPASVHVSGFASLDTTTLYALLRLRVDVFVVEQDCAYPELDGRDTEASTRHLWTTDSTPDATEEETTAPTAYLRLLEEPDGTRRIGRVCSAGAHRGEGLAGLLVEEALRLAAGREVVLEAQAHLQDWYERFGFDVSGPDYVEDGIPHVPMRRSVGE